LEGLRPFLMGNGAMSLDTLPNADGEEGSMHGLIADENNDFVAQLADERDEAFLVRLISEALEERELYVLNHRTGLGGAKVKPVGELAQELGMSPQNISRMEKAVQKKLADVPGLKEIWELMD